MSEPLYAVYGSSGFGREVMPLARQQLLMQGIRADQLVFIDDSAPENSVNGHAVSRYEKFLATPASARYAVIAIANSLVREQIARKMELDGVRAWSVRAANVISLDELQIGEGSILNPFVTLTSNAVIGRHFHGNIYSYVAHDCVIGDFVTFAPSVKCNGNVRIEDHAYIGTGAIIKQGSPEKPLIIGRGAVVGMGAVVTRDVTAGTTVVGNPARPWSKT